MAAIRRAQPFPAMAEGAPPTALVDLAKPSYRMGIARIKVGWEGHQLGVKVKADKEKYSVRETAKVAIDVKTPGGKAPRNADVAFAAVDEALLQLAPNESWDILAAMMGDRTLDVLTSTAQMQVVGKRHYGRKAISAGGGGGHSPTRELFDTLLLWKPSVVLDAQGRATGPAQPATARPRATGAALSEYLIAWGGFNNSLLVNQIAYKLRNPETMSGFRQAFKIVYGQSLDDFYLHALPYINYVSANWKTSYATSPEALAFITDGLGALKAAGTVVAATKIAAEKTTVVKKLTITCVKGKLTKKVNAVKPVCPTGYKKK